MSFSLRAHAFCLPEGGIVAQGSVYPIQIGSSCSVLRKELLSVLVYGRVDSSGFPADLSFIDAIAS